jgi:hypothetical protein
MKQRRWLLRIVLALAAGATAAAATWFLWPAAKVAVRTLIHVPPYKPWLLRNAGAVPDLQNQQRAQVALMKSRLVLQTALRDKKVAGLPTVAEHADPVEWLEKEVQADFSVAPTIIRISLSRDKPEDLVVLVNALREAYLREVVERENTQRRERLNKLREMREKFEGQLRANRDERKKLEPAVVAKDAGAQALILAFLQQQLATVEREFLKAKTDLQNANAQLKADQARQKDLAPLPVAPALVDAEVEQHPEVKELRQKVKRLEQSIAVNVKEAVQGEADPLIKELKDKLTVAQEALAARRREVRPEAEQASRRKAQAELDRNISVLQARIAVLTESAAFFEKEATKLRTAIQERAANGAHLHMLKENLGHIEDLVKRLAVEEAAQQVQLAAPKHEQVLEPAVVSHAGAGRGRIAAAALAGLACALLAFACLSLRARVSLR